MAERIRRDQLPQEGPCFSLSGPAWREAEAYGCDMSLLELSLEKTPEERLQELYSFIALVESLRAAMGTR